MTLYELLRYQIDCIRSGRSLQYVSLLVVIKVANGSLYAAGVKMAVASVWTFR